MAVLVFALLHLLVVQPFVEAVARRTEAKSDLDDARSVSAAVDDLVDETRAFDRAAGGVQRLIDSELQSLIETFAELNETMGALRALLPEEAAGPQGQAAVAGGESVQAPFAQQAQTGRSGLPPMESELRASVARGEGLTEPLVEWINVEIVDPVFKRINQQLPSIAEDLRERGLQVNQRIESAVAAGVDGNDPVLLELKRRISAAVEAADALVYEPPDNPRWWDTVAGKARALTTADLRIEIGRLEALDQLDTSMKEVVANAEDVNKELSRKIAELESQFAQTQQEVAGALGLPGGIPLALRSVTPWFPGLLAAAFAALLVWQIIALRQLAFAAEIFGEKEGAAVTARLVSSTALPIINLGRCTALLAWCGAALWMVAQYDQARPALFAQAVFAVLVLSGASVALEVTRRASQRRLSMLERSSSPSEGIT